MLSLFSCRHAESFWKNHKLGDPLYPPLAEAVSHYRLANGPVCDLFRVKIAGHTLPVNQGRWNFDTNPLLLLDDNVASGHLKGQAHLIYVSRTAPKLGDPYIGKNFAKGYIVKDEHKTNPRRTRAGWRFNIQRRFFRRRVRENHSLAFDFEWMNKALFLQTLQPGEQLFPEY